MRFPLLAISGPLEVELVGDKTSLVGPLVIAGAAIVAAVVAAYWQWRQLRHDREVRDREFIRNSIGQAVASLATTIDDMSGFSVATRAVDKAEAETRDLEAKDRTDAELSESMEVATRAIREARDARQVVQSSAAKMMTDNLHLRVALGMHDPVVASHKELCEALEQWFERLTPDRPTQVKRESGELDPGELFRPARDRFEAACFAWITDQR